MSDAGMIDASFDFPHGHDLKFFRHHLGILWKLLLHKGSIEMLTSADLLTATVNYPGIVRVVL